jgi:molybdate transport system ATP-binding protein
VALGRAILSGPELLLLDEPLSASDAALREAISSYLQRVIDEYRLPTLLVTHDAESVARLASQTVAIPRA